MKTILYSLFFISGIGVTLFAVTASWKVKPNEASVTFAAGKINGSFKGLKADIDFDKDHPEKAKIAATIDAPSIATGFFLKNNHAKDALGVDKYPTIKFVSTAVSKNAGGFVAKGNLTMKGVTKPAAINFTFDDKGAQGVFKGKFTVIPKEYGINRSGTPDKVVVDLLVPVTKS